MAKRPDIPFKAIADQALLSIDTLLGRWLPDGKTQSGEYKATNPLRADNKIGSFSINIRTGKWADFATNDAGNDLISLYAYLEGLSQVDAAIEVADMIAFNLPEGCRPDEAEKPRQKPVINPDDVKQAKQKEPSPWHPITPVPSNADEVPVAHPNRGVYAMRWEYKDANGQSLGWVYRFNTSDGGKETLPLTWCKNEKTGKCEWRWMQWPEPNRPIYGLDRLAAKPDAWVLLVEGEKCADAPVDMIQGVVVSWPGGGKAIEKVDWSALAGRNIYAWADCDNQRERLTKAEKDAGLDPLSKPVLPEHEQPGMKAMLRIAEILKELDPSTKFKLVDIPACGEKPDGWDVADAIADGMNAEQLTAFINKTRPHLTLAASNDLPDAENEKSISGAISATAEDQEKDPTWVDYLFRKRGDIQACLSNVVDVIQNDTRWKEILAYDEFSQRVVKLKPPPFWNNAGEEGEWDAQDDARLAMWITKVWRFSPSPALVAEAVEVAARDNVINPPKDWLLKLKWDGNKRVDTWLLDYLGVPMNEYSKRVARFVMMGMVKRVTEPGCKFDYCLVLEGKQGLKKSSALSALGGEWYGDTDLDLHNKDSMSALRGKMLYEFSELGSVARAEATKQKSFLSRQVDEYRPVYGRREIRTPRQVVFSGTTNEWEWNKDPTGGRRFWPVMVTQEIDVEGIKTIRDQLFAEAVVMVKEGLRYWPTNEEQAKIFDPEQLKRSVQDSLMDALHDHVMNYTGVEFSLHYAATEWLKLDVSKLTRDVQTRIGIALRQLGCSRFEKRGNALTRFWYKVPERKEPTSSGEIVGANYGGDDDVSF